MHKPTQDNKWTAPRIKDAEKLIQQASEQETLLKGVEEALYSPSEEGNKLLTRLGEHLKALQRTLAVYRYTCHLEQEEISILQLGRLPRREGPQFDKEAAERGYQIIAPHLGLSSLTPDTQVRCLSYLIVHMDEIIDIPPGLALRIIPVTYMGGPYPSIGIYSEYDTDLTTQISDIVTSYERLVENYVHKISLERLMELSADETITWREILDQFGD